MKHKHAEVIKAFVDGIECQAWDFANKKWHDIKDLTDFTWADARIKPEPPKEQEPQYLYVYNDERECKTWMSPELIRYTDGWVYLGKVRIERNRDEYNKKQREYRAKRKAIGNPITRKS